MKIKSRAGVFGGGAGLRPDCQRKLPHAVRITADLLTVARRPPDNVVFVADFVRLSDLSEEGGTHRSDMESIASARSVSSGLFVTVELNRAYERSCRLFALFTEP